MISHGIEWVMLDYGEMMIKQGLNIDYLRTLNRNKENNMNQKKIKRCQKVIEDFLKTYN